MQLLPMMVGIFLLALVLLDAFQTIILPRRPVGRFRITRLFFLATWYPWSVMARVLRVRRMREQMYSIYGPMALLLLFSVWALLLIVAYALIYLGLRMPFHDPLQAHSLWHVFRSCLYVSGTTLFTLGIGDVQPITRAARMLIVAEAGTGLGFFALVVGYVPVLYSAFSEREVTVALLDARAGSPPTAGELLLRHSFRGGHEALAELLSEWERWSAVMLETHVSYPILCYYRSQHDNQSWLSAVTAVLDVCALLITTVEGSGTRQAQLTFAMARHTLVDLGHVFHLEKAEQRHRERPAERLQAEELKRLRAMLVEGGFALCGASDAPARLAAIRLLYEPHAQAMADYLGLELPRWTPSARDPRKPNSWETVASLRTPNALTDRLYAHVSEESTATRLHEEDWKKE